MQTTQAPFTGVGWGRHSRRQTGIPNKAQTQRPQVLKRDCASRPSLLFPSMRCVSYGAFACADVASILQVSSKPVDSGASCSPCERLARGAAKRQQRQGGCDPLRRPLFRHGFTVCTRAVFARACGGRGLEQGSERIGEISPALKTPRREASKLKIARIFLGSDVFWLKMKLFSAHMLVKLDLAKACLFNDLLFLVLITGCRLLPV